MRLEMIRHEQPAQLHSETWPTSGNSRYARPYEISFCRGHRNSRRMEEVPRRGTKDCERRTDRLLLDACDFHRTERTKFCK
ncbi:unnamed protein product [Hymenolepis diminuta]|uniref:Uncharacterized protein n=1 Tax=Hymenolepis diminuta TaxID=6216 RepID=A0A564Y0E5_HYMDI|nr:unnamed protein product [Hymenolepis diminuta]